MSPLGATDVRTALIVILCAGALYTDIKYKKIKNAWVLPFFALGLVLALYEGAFKGLLGALTAAGLGLLAFLIPYLSKHMAAGDLKLMAALGALVALPLESLRIAILSVLVGAVLAVGIMTYRRKWGAFLMRIQLKRIKIDTEIADKSNKMPFGVAIAVAAVWLRFQNPLEWLGIEAWLNRTF